MHKVTWYRRRLATMSPAEIAWRVRTVVAGRARRLAGATPRADLPPGWTADAAAASLAQLRAPGRTPALLSRDRVAEILDRHPGLAEQAVASADDALTMRCTFFGYPTVTLDRPVDWSFDPVRGTRWPDLPADRIDHRTVDGDVKWIWELNRLQHLPLLAQAWLVTGDERYAAAALDDLESWIAANPPGHGIAWRGAFEAGIRALSVAVAVVALADAPGMTPERYGAVAAMLDASARYCVRGRSRYSSANNHLVGELAGLAAVALMIPGLDGADRWERIALDELAVEADRQILADGVGAEQAVGYQVFTTELLAVVATLVADRDGAAPDRLVAALLRGADFLAGLGTPTPQIGDDDEGFALRLSDEPVRTVAAHLDLVAAFTDGPAPAGSATTPARAWFAAALGDADRPRAADVATVRGPGGSRWHREGGLVVLRAPGRRVTVDVGPLGYLAIAAHGHADALAVTVADDHGEIVEDPGTGSYYGHPAWRRVLRGTAAHATVCVDGQDQSDMGGPFLWTRHARTRVRAVDLAAGVVDAEHDGYTGGPDGVVHRRWVIAPPQLPGVLIVDLVTGSGEHDVTTTHPLAADVDVDASDAGFALSRDGDHIAHIVTASTQPVRPWSVRGDETTDRGWSSHRLEQRTPAWWVGWQSFGRTTRFVEASFINVTTEFALGCDVSLTDDGSTIRIHLLCEGVRQECVVDTHGDGLVSFEVETAL